MAHSLADVKRRILARVSLPTLINETVPLQTRSGRQVGLCPFHSEKSPSFTIYDDRYYCFGCKEHGDAIEFIKKTQGLSFLEALRLLAGKFGVEAPELEETSRQLRQQRFDQSLYTLMQAAQDFFVAQLSSARPAAAAARAYLGERGFSEPAITDLAFGLTPEEPFGLVRHLRQQGFKQEDMVACCLATLSNKENRLAFDFFRHRVMIPIHDSQGRIIAFGGRTTDGHPAKYMNSGATKLFDKGQTLFGFDRARKAIRERQRAVIVEGYMDAMQLWQHGLSETVACLGTAFTEWHLKQLRHTTSQVILLFDGDTAGQKATLSSVSVALLVPEIRVKAVELSGGDDPDSFVRRQGAEALEALLAKASDLLDFAIRKRLAATHALGVPELVSKEFIPWIAQISDRLQQSALLLRIAHLTGLPADQLERELRPLKGGGAAATTLLTARPPQRLNTTAHQPLAPLDPVIFDLFGHIFHATPAELSPDQANGLMNIFLGELEIDERYLAFLQEMLTQLQQGIAPNTAAAADYTATLTPELAQLLAKLQQSTSAFTCNDRMLRLEKALAHMRLRRTKSTIHALKAQLARAAAMPRSVESDAETDRLLKLISDLGRDLSPNQTNFRP